VKGIEIVVNFDMPSQIEDYIHRIGRTGRAGATGVAVSFMTEKHSRLARELLVILREAKQDIPQGLEQMGGRGGRSAPSRYRQRY
jgi:ATP-dependent RNA helicase DDX5/DBP2